MSEPFKNGVPVSIPQWVLDEIEEELARIGSPRLTPGGLVAAAWKAYRRDPPSEISDEAPEQVAIYGLNPLHRALVEEFIRLLEDPADRKHIAFRDAVVSVLTDRMEAQRSPENQVE